MSDGEWGEDSASSNQRSSNQRGRGGRGRGSYNRSNDFDSSQGGGDNWGNDNNSGGGGWIDRGDDEGSSRGRGGRGGRGGGRGRGRTSDNNASDGNNFGGDEEQPPVSDKPRPTYIPPEIDDNDLSSVEVGMNFDKYQNIEVKVSGDSVPTHIETFKSSGLREVLVDKLIQCKYTTPTPIQKYAIPVIISGRDIMASAQTGSGKTVSVQNFL